MSETLEHILTDRAKMAKPLPPLLPVGASTDLPSSDAVEEISEPAKVDFLSVPLFLHYVDAKSAHSRRRVTLYALSRSDCYWLSSFCHERHAVRCFRGDRISQMIDLGTGEVLETSPAISEYLNGIMGDEVSPRSPTDMLVRDYRAGLNLLVFLARCDGQAHPSEIDVLLGYLDHVASAPGIDAEVAKRHIARIHPEETVFLRSLKRLQRTDPEELWRVCRTARKLVDADGVLSEAEATFVERLAAADRRRVRKN